MINAIALVFIENAFFSWLFDVTPKAAVMGAVMWIFLRWAAKYGNYESRFTRIESDLTRIESELSDLKKTVAGIDTRLGRVEGQLEVIIDLLKNKK